MNLHLQFDPATHPDGPDVREIWSKISLTIRNENEQVIKEIFTIEWVLKELIDWVTENKTAIINEEPPPAIVGSSIAHGISTFYNKAFTEDMDSTVEAVYEYRLRHGFRFALRGTNIPDIYIGIFHGKHTISLDGREKWAYEIHPHLFFQAASHAHDFL